MVPYMQVATITIAGGVSANYIAKWDGSTWSALGSGMDYSVEAIAISNTSDVYVGGDFNVAGGKSSHYFGFWHEPQPLPTNTPTDTLLTRRLTHLPIHLRTRRLTRRPTRRLTLPPIRQPIRTHLCQLKRQVDRVLLLCRQILQLIPQLSHQPILLLPWTQARPLHYLPKRQVDRAQHRCLPTRLLTRQPIQIHLCLPRHQVDRPLLQRLPILQPL